MTLTVAPSPLTQATLVHQPAGHPHLSPQSFPLQELPNLNSLPADELAITTVQHVPPGLKASVNAFQDSIKPPSRLREATRRVIEQNNQLQTSPKMKKMLENAPRHSSVFSVPLTFTPNHDSSLNHSYFNSEDLEFNRVLAVLNSRINAEQALQDTLKETSPANLNLKLFSTPSNRLETAYNNLDKAHAGKFIPILTKAIKSGKDGFEEREGQVSAYSQLDRLMGREFSIDVAHSHLQKFLQSQLGYGATQVMGNSEEQKIIQNWRVKTAARYALDKATKINNTWTEWGVSALVSTAWSFGLEILAKNAAVNWLFRSDLTKTDFNKLPKWRQLLLGIPEEMANPIIASASGAQKVGAVAIGVFPQGTAEIPDVLLVQGAIQRSGDGKLTAWQGFKRAIATKKLSTGAAVLVAAAGTSFEKAKGLLWNPTTIASKIGHTATGFITNSVSVLSCGLPFFTEGGPQTAEAAKLLAETYNPSTGSLKLPEKDRVSLMKNGTAKGVKQYFERVAKEQILHLSPISKVVAASVPVAVTISLIPSAINGIGTFLPAGRATEIVKAGVSFLQVPIFGPIELLALNTVASLNRSYPNMVTKLSKVGRPIIDGVYAPFAIGRRVISNAGSWWRSEKPENPYEVYQDFLKEINRPA